MDTPDINAAQSQPVGGPPPELSRADIADYLDRANYDPEKAKVLAARERLTNLGAAPEAVARATPQPVPWLPQASPSTPPPAAPMAQPAGVQPLAAPRAALVPTPAAKPQPQTAPAADFRAGLVPKQSSKAAGVDFTAGLVPKDAATGDTAGTSATPSQPTLGQVLMQPTDKTDKEYLGYTGPAGVAGATIKGLDDVARGTKDAFTGMYDAVRHPIDTIRGIAKLPAQAAEVPDAIHDINESADPTGRYLEAAQDTVSQGAGQALAAIALSGAGGKGKLAGVQEPIEGAPLTMGEAAGPGLRQGAEKLLSKTSTAEKRMGTVMADRTAAMQNAAEQVSPATPSAEATGTTVQNAARDVLDRQQQAQSLVGDLADRAKGEAETARITATEKAGSAAQDAATRMLNTRRVAGVQAGKSTAKALSGVDELPVPETDRAIISSLREANSAAKVEESAAHNTLAESAKAKGITVDPTPMQSVAKEVVSLEGPAKDLVMSSLPSTVYKTLEKVAGRSTSEADVVASRAKDFGWDAENLTEQQSAAIKKDLADHPAVAGDPETSGPVPYQTMKTARTAVGEALQAARKHFQQTGMGSNASRTLQSLYGSMTEAMKASVADDPELSAQFEKANALTRERTSTFVDPKAIRKLVYADDPGKVIGSVMRSGSDADVAALRTALDADKTGQALSRAQRGAMDYVLRKSAKAATSDLPAGVSPEATDYDLATRNAKSSTALRAILGDEKYTKFVKDLDTKRLSQRTPDEINLDNQLTKIAKADSPEKAAKLAGYDASTDAGVKAADQKAATAVGVRERMQSPSVTEQGPQKVAGQVANDLEPSKMVERAAASPEYTDKLLQVLDKHPNATYLRQTLGKRIFRNASDGAMVRGAFGSTDGVFDVSKFQTSYTDARPSLAKILPPENLSAMDKFNDALNKYALSKGVGGGAGMGGRFMAMRQIFGVLSMARGVLAASPASFATGAAASFGPRIWMEIATRPALANAMTKALSTSASMSGKSAATAAVAGGISKAGDDSSKQGFQRPAMEEHKTAGMAAAAEAPNTPEHLRPHLRKMAGTSVPEKGAIVMLPGGQRATVEYSSPHDKTPVVKVRMDDGKAIRYVGRKEVDVLKPAAE